MDTQKISGIVFYEGPSLLDGKPIVGIATLDSANVKTGNLVQTWIMRQNVNPITAVNYGFDESVCGDCPLRGIVANKSERTDKKTKYADEPANKGRGCYVLLHMAPANIWRCYRSQIYPKLNKDNGNLFNGKGLRYGSYGDPVSIPILYWNNLIKYCTGNFTTGYTHQWKQKRFSHWKRRLMASTHSIAENELAHSMGWRTFRTMDSVGNISSTEIICPASKEGNFRKTCETCGACDGAKEVDNRRSIAIVAHGSGGKPNFLHQIHLKG